MDCKRFTLANYAIRYRAQSSMSQATKSTLQADPIKVRETMVATPTVYITHILSTLRTKQMTDVSTVFAGKDASRALGQTSTKEEDVRPDWEDLPEKEKQTLDDWFTFFQYRYNIKGKVQGEAHL